MKSYNLKTLDDCNTDLVILDSLMGSGKTTALMSIFADSPKQPIVFVYPYDIPDDDKLREKLKGLNFHIAKYKENGKFDFFKEAIAAGSRVVVTHMLFKTLPPSIFTELKAKKYHVYIDEVMDVSQPLDESKISKQHQKYLIEDSFNYDAKSKLLLSKRDYQLHDCACYAFGDGYMTQMNRLNALAQSGYLSCVNQSIVVTLNLRYLKELERVVIATFDFKRSLMARTASQQGLSFKVVDTESFGLDQREAASNLTENLILCDEYRSFEQFARESNKVMFSANWYDSLDANEWKECNEPAESAQLCR